MGATIAALSDSRTALQRHPTLLAYTTLVVVAMTVTALVMSAIGLVIPLVPQLVVSVVVVPVGLTAIIGMVFAGVSGERPIDGATRALREYAVSLIGAHAVYQFVVFGFVLLVTLLAVFGVGLGAVSTGAGLGGEPNAAAAAALAGGASLLVLSLTGLVFLVLLLTGLLVQFLDVAVVLSGASAIGSYRTVVRFVLDAPLSVLGYTAMRSLVAVCGVVVPLGAVGAVMNAAGVGDLATVGVLGLLSLLLLPLVATFLYVYHVAYYQRRRRTPIV
ncbi:MAG: hypothetical protein ABEH47_02315 [Haloferacaceae archaeon]